MTDIKWLVYSREHNAWRREGGAIYTTVMRDAERYSYDEAKEIVVNSGRGGTRSHVDAGPPAFMVPDPECIVEGAVEPGEDEIATGNLRDFLEMEPSDTERAEWPEHTRAYVESLQWALDELQKQFAACNSERGELEVKLHDAEQAAQAAQQRIEDLEAENARLRRDIDQYRRDLEQCERRRDTLTNDYLEVSDVLAECITTIEADLRGKRTWADSPNLKRRYDRDMDIVRRARKAAGLEVSDDRGDPAEGADTNMIRAAAAILRTDRPLSADFREQVARMLEGRSAGLEVSDE